MLTDTTTLANRPPMSDDMIKAEGQAARESAAANSATTGLLSTSWLDAITQLIRVPSTSVSQTGMPQHQPNQIRRRRASLHPYFRPKLTTILECDTDASNGMTPFPTDLNQRNASSFSCSSSSPTVLSARLPPSTTAIGSTISYQTPPLPLPALLLPSAPLPPPAKATAVDNDSSSSCSDSGGRRSPVLAQPHLQRRQATFYALNEKNDVMFWNHESQGFEPVYPPL
jgi:hypothetical protein